MRAGYTLRGITGRRQVEPVAGATGSNEANREDPPGALESSVPGFFAVGDVRRGSIKRVASAVGEGSVVVSAVHTYLARAEQG